MTEELLVDGDEVVVEAVNVAAVDMDVPAVVEVLAGDDAFFIKKIGRVNGKAEICAIINSEDE